MKTPHKHAEVIKAWADGAQIQEKRPCYNLWKDVGIDGAAVLFSNGSDYRVKPEVVKYRRFLWGSPHSKQVLTVHEEEQKREPRETWVNFVRWIDTDWQEVEV